MAVEGTDRGYRADRVLSMVVDPLGSRYPTAESLLQFYEAVEEEVRTLSGVESVAWATPLPLGRSYQRPRFVEIVSAARSADSDPPAADYQIVSPAYFGTVDVPIVSGRPFDDRDARDTCRSACERGVRPQASPGPIADRRARGDPADHRSPGEAGRA